MELIFSENVIPIIFYFDNIHAFSKLPSWWVYVDVTM